MKNIKFKDNGPEVLDLQNQLIKLFYALSPDSDFGNNTLAAIQAFQTLHSIPVTGVVNDATYTAIINDVFLNTTVVDKSSMDKIAKLHPKIRHEILFLVKECFAKTGIKIRIAQGLRTFAEQAAIYAQGRTTPGKIVTKANAGLSNHNYGLAIDFVILKSDGTVSWDTYVDADHDGQRDWIEVINIFKARGYKSGIDWNFVDAPHLEKMFGLSIRQLLDLHNSGKIDKEGYVLV